MKEGRHCFILTICFSVQGTPNQESRRVGIHRASWSLCSSSRTIHHRAAWPGCALARPRDERSWTLAAGQALLGLGREMPSHLRAPGRPSQLFHLPFGTILHRAQENTCCCHTRLHFPFQALMRWDNGCRKVCTCKSVWNICSRYLSSLQARLGERRKCFRNSSRPGLLTLPSRGQKL